MSILNVNTIQPVGSAQTVTVSATNLKIGSTTLQSGSITLGNSVLSSTSTGISTSTTSTRNSGVSTAIGSLIYNATANTLQVYNGTQWLNILTTTAATSTFSATGGNAELTPGNGSKYHVYTSTGPNPFVVSSGTITAEVLVVGGGGGGGTGGGGAGGIIYSAEVPLTPGTYVATVGTGGAASGAQPAAGGDGGNSSFANPGGPWTMTGYGGGGGGARVTVGRSGGSSGGDGHDVSVGMFGNAACTQPGHPSLPFTVVNYGHDGGGTMPGGTWNGGGGGGGAGSVGQTGDISRSDDAIGGNGGMGAAFPNFNRIHIGPAVPAPFANAMGDAGYFGGGGGAGINIDTGTGPAIPQGGLGNLGGFGSRTPNGNGTAAIGYGGGGGGADYQGASGSTATGAPGIVIIRYKL